MWRLTALLLVSVATVCSGQQQPVPLTATPNRPTVTNTAETTQIGVLEIELGIYASEPQRALQGLLKFGLLRDLELDWAGNPLQKDTVSQDLGVSDTYVGFRWRFLHQTRTRPTFTLQYSTKIPTAGSLQGSGEMDQIVSLLCSKDLPARFHVDANLSRQWLGRPRGGFDRNWVPAFTVSYSLTDKWSIASDFALTTRANAATPTSIQNLWAVSYALKPRLVLDSGVQFRLAGNVPKVVYLGGFTYSIAGLYHRKR